MDGIKTFVSHLGCGAVSGGITSSVLAPIERVRILM